MLKIFVILGVLAVGLLFYYQPKLHLNDKTNACGVVYGGLSPYDPYQTFKTNERVCVCTGNSEIIDERSFDGNYAKFCAGWGVSIKGRWPLKAIAPNPPTGNYLQIN